VEKQPSWREEGREEESTTHPQTGGKEETNFLINVPLRVGADVRGGKRKGRWMKRFLS